MRIGIDLVELNKIDNDKLINRILSEEEKKHFNSITNDKAKKAYVGGRFSAKEALFKAISNGNLTANYHDITVLNNEFGKPYIITNLVDKNCIINVSISHTDNYATAIVIIEDNKL